MKEGALQKGFGKKQVRTRFIRQSKEKKSQTQSLGRKEVKAFNMLLKKGGGGGEEKTPTKHVSLNPGFFGIVL